jgi:D-glycerate 3-kinase
MSGPDLTARIIAWVEAEAGRATASPALLMVSGAQGIGKSTAMAELAVHPTLRVAVLGLDDVYHTQATRAALATTVHPLCATRGPPGTHDLALLRRTLESLRDAHANSQTPLPRFDKRTDDRAPVDGWRVYTGRPDVIVFEGWCLGVQANPDAPSSPPLNALEAAHDGAGIWRGWQEEALAGPYAALWAQADGFLHLKAPAFDAVLTWRTQQEETTLGLARGTLPRERRLWVEGFIQHYERLTRRMLAGAHWPGAEVRVDAERLPVEP